MDAKIRQQWKVRKRRLQRRLDPGNLQGCQEPLFTAANIHIEISDRDRGIATAALAPCICCHQKQYRAEKLWVLGRSD